MANQIEVLRGALRVSILLFEQSGEMAHLQDAIQYGQNAFSQISLESPHHLTFLIALRELFAKLYYQTYNLNCLTQAIEYGREAVNLIPKENPDRAGHLNNLGIYLSRRYGRDGKQEDLTQAIEYSREAVDLTPKERICSAIDQLPSPEHFDIEPFNQSDSQLTTSDSQQTKQASEPVFKKPKGKGKR